LLFSRAKNEVFGVCVKINDFGGNEKVDNKKRNFVNGLKNDKQSSKKI